MTDDRLLDDDDLKAAFRAVRETYDGTNAESDSTLHRALFRTRTRGRRQRFTRWVVVPIAAVLAASTAWAGVTGKLNPAVQSVLESFHAERTPPAPALSPPGLPSVASVVPAPVDEAPPDAVVAPSESTPPELPVAEPSPIVTPSARPDVVPPPSTSARAAGSAAAPPVAEVAVRGEEPAPVPAPSASAPDPHAALFAEAHRLHFIERDPARALAAWNRYLATDPNGRFAPEARYNRALALVRLGRVAEAKTELAAFANGSYGSYRRDEAKALLDALTRDTPQP